MTLRTALVIDGEADGAIQALVQTSAGLDELSHSGATAAAAVSGVGSSSIAAAPKVSTLARAATGAAAAQQLMAQSSRDLAFRQRMLAFQLNDVVVSLASGMNPMMVFMQQGSQISQIYAGQGGVSTALKDVRASATGLFGSLGRGGPLIAGLAAAAAAGIGGMTYEINRASKSTVSFADVATASFQVIGSAIGTFIKPAVDAIAPWFAAAWSAVVAGVKIAGNTIINSFRAAFSDVMFVWDQFPNAFGALFVGGANAAIKAIEFLVNKAVDALNLFADQANAVIGMIPGAEQWQLGKLDQISIGQIPNLFADALGQANAAHAADVQAIMASDPLGAFFDAVQAQAMANALDDVGGKAAEAGGALKSAAEAAKDPWEGLREAIGDTGDKLKESLDFAKGVFKGLIADLKSGLASGEGFFQSLANAALNALDKITERWLDSALNGLFDMVMGSLGGSLFGSRDPWSGLRMARGGVFGSAGVTAFARGGVVGSPALFPFANGVGLMGEAGPEAIMPLKRDASGRLGVAAQGEAGGVREIRVTVGWSKDADGNIRPMVEEVSENASGRAIERFNRLALPARVAQIQRDPRRK